ncbi:unnamed protein product [Danaus chrysippus]|uniref:(African queen) hypothetical protein n=1 Tax=Danaus chrysippus TaxID=151541 RepID=A0A8J2W4G8_9NEOP|nr:unnamed protein product [Danaus chrysippus]
MSCISSCSEPVTYNNRINTLIVIFQYRRRCPKTSRSKQGTLREHERPNCTDAGVQRLPAPNKEHSGNMSDPTVPTPVSKDFPLLTRNTLREHERPNCTDAGVQRLPAPNKEHSGNMSDPTVPTPVSGVQRLPAPNKEHSGNMSDPTVPTPVSKDFPLLTRNTPGT